MIRPFGTASPQSCRLILSIFLTQCVSLEIAALCKPVSVASSFMPAAITERKHFNMKLTRDGGFR